MKPLPKTVLTKFEELAANTVLREELDKDQSNMTTIDAAIYKMASSVVEALGQKKMSNRTSRGETKLITQLRKCNRG